ncbi:C-terminal binding protein [Plantactinospora soyae]|uniref:D-3-phosphoglycerate dehydrogenase n=1 Tax=Plantactinospora soyae TaxID=1544732 RepID=A0A927R7U2_9ACTN|nr:C-terminal binding protein [Plantactinospora soyae]MBE1489809.1 D-3-phosphoglycerate dehydrogenase [Plantactinospora soyae]
MRVVYTDPAWALDARGRPDPSRADLERGILGPEVSVEFGPFESGTDPGPADGAQVGPSADGGFVTCGDQLFEAARGADALVIYRCQVTSELVEALRPSCRVVARSGVGFDNLRPDLLATAGIYGFNVPDYCGDEVSTHTVALLLGLERQICVQDRLVRDNRWGIHRGGIPRRTAERTVGIVGFGRIGRASARKLQPFYHRVLAHDPYVAADLMASHGVAPVPSLRELFARSDAVVIHAALTPETDGLVGAAALGAAGPGSLLVNTARGRLVDTKAVLDALDTGQLAGFASDVFAPEDPNASPTARKLLARNDVIVSSHRAFLSAESELSLRRRIAAGVRAVLVDDAPPPEGRLA